MKTRMEELEAQKEEIQADMEREEINRQIVTREEMLFFLRQFMDGDPQRPGIPSPPRGYLHQFYMAI